MNDFQTLIREALLGEEHLEQPQGSQELKVSIRNFENQDRLLRTLLFVSILLQSVLCAWSGWMFWQADAGSSTKSLILYATLFLLTVQSIGWTKMFLFSNQKSFSILKELKRVQLLLLEK